jgi:hypothetical protein
MPSKGGVVPTEDVDLELQPLRKNDRRIEIESRTVWEFSYNCQVKLNKS